MDVRKPPGRELERHVYDPILTTLAANNYLRAVACRNFP